MINQMIKKAGSKGLLVLNTDGLGLQASVVNGNRHELAIKYSVHSREIDPFSALKDVLTQLKMYLGKSLPTETVLLHINAIPSHVALSQSSGANLAEMMRWEMDGIVADQSPMWDLDWLLLQRHHINDAQYLTLLELVREEKLSAQLNASNAQRVGDIAIREQMATAEQVAECLQIQQKLQLPDQRLLTQWRPLPTAESDHDADFMAGEQQAYLCSAMPITQHLQWVNAFNKIAQTQGMPKLALKQVYPLASTTVALLDHHDDRVLLTEFHPAYVFCAVIEQGILKQTLMLKSSSQPLDVAAMAELLKAQQLTDVDSWIVANIDGVDANFVAMLEASLGLRAELMPRACDIKLSLPTTSKVCLLSELGAAAHYYGRSPLLVSPLSGMPPPEAFYKQKRFRTAMAIAVAPLILLGYEGFRYLQINQKQNELNQIEQELARYGDDNSDIEAEIKQAAENIQTYKALELDLNGLQYRKELVQTVLLKRQAVVEKLLPTLSHSINDGIILDSMNETNWYQFTITGRAVDQNSIDEFNRVLSINLQPLNMQIIDSPSRLEQKDAYSYGGVYVFEFTLIKRSDA